MLYSRFFLLTFLIILTIDQSRGVEFGSIFGLGKNVDKIENHEENKLEHEPKQKVEQNKLINFIPIFDFGKNVDKNDGKNDDINIDNINIDDINNQGENKLEYEEPEENFEVNQVSTKLSTVEEFLSTLLIPVEALGNANKIFGKGVQQIISKIPDKLKDPIKGFEINNKTNLGYGQFLNSISDRFRAIYPGTVWCGDGDIAKNDEDLGFFASTDACCRDHDKCSSNINAGETKYGLKNVGLFTRSHRSCDSAFYNCLKGAKSIIATKIGITYFNILSPQSFDEDYPIVKCNKYSGLINKKCIDYKQDLHADKKYQWFDNPFF
ncbi:PREDICTED: uncharacterized protein LOC107070516 [Polistes dominula]|uniref:phospholipase A2 n=1 Tax=Polistes dominula TaxID=743375 RepID=A0ABM1IVP0_POLDO|nr:PREDICTED: uncharacterized protein LOC107070516 [Polistes dominula]XP_015184278.1 PREDICTED: uncharacterized protein LOC107070516 [Polistes dominula]